MDKYWLKYVLMSIILASLASCGKVGVSGKMAQVFGNWAEVKLPDGCKVQQIAAEEGSGIAILCEDGRVFH